ncbi:nucleoside monophosphate kinase [Candidatus Woesebacteria bacterium]|nr:nucleoside monophosphate kinase [Candidatus Woesebacteria bacterium]
MGPQGSGKGTQAKIIAEKLGLFHMESGKMLRVMAKTDKRIRNMVKKGLLVPDRETINYIEKHLTDNNAGFDNLIFDGYPRTLSQFELLVKWLRSKGKDIDYIIFLNVSEDESVKRLSSRRTCSKCGEVYNLITNPPSKQNACNCGGELFQREDDKPDTIRKRLNIFNSQTKPIIEKVREDGKLIEVDGERDIDVISNDIIARLKEKNVRHN